MILLAVVLGLTSLCVLWCFTYLKHQKIFSAFPGPTTISIFGNLFPVNSDEYIHTFLQLISKYGEIVKLPFGFSPKLLICGVKPIKFLLSSNVLIDKGDDYQCFRRWLGDSSLVSGGDKWRTRRRLLNSGFHYNILERFVEVFERQCDVLIKKLEIIKGNFDVYPYIKLYTLDVICEAVMSTSVNVQKNSNSDYIHNVEIIMKIIVNRFLSPLKLLEFIYKFTADYKKELQTVKFLHSFSNLVIEKRMNEYDYTNSTINNDKHKKPSILDILLSSKMDGKPLPLEVIREEVDTFMFAGHDTTSIALSFVLYCLSKHLDIQEKCLQELNEVIGRDCNKRFGFKDLGRLKYLDQVVKETMRMYPPVVFITRSIKKDTYYQGQLWPKNLQLILFLYGLHQQPSLYPNPEKFDPERFSVENCKSTSLYSYIPFSAGPRNCIGQRLAVLMIKFSVVNILRKFEILPVVNHQPLLKGDALLYSDNGLPIQLQKRR